MELFQTSVLKKYRKLQDKKAIEKAYKKYVDYFHNSERQQNIIEIKEEGFQQKFLMELFVNVFEYVINPDPNYNLTTEYKNEKGARKADGAILKDKKALAVIELKSIKTKDLEKVRKQAFDYKANHSECVYVITSNFEKLRFYINIAVDFEEFNLFTMNKEQFELLYLCLHKDNILQNIPLKIKTDSVVAEEKITKTFYSDYSLFKRELFRDLVKQNLKNEIFRTELQKEDADRATKNIKQALFKKSQKLIDRFLFIFFAEDKGLLSPNSTLKILHDWDKLNELDTDIPLYDRFKLYFKYLDEGRKGTDKKAEIFAYNGGLFKPDPILNSLIIDDKLLYKHTKTLSDYDFESQVGVNILGHIFENSLNEIESVNAEIEGIDFDKQKTKRKKDGVFYTPKYITKYIVDNTVGKLCEEKKQELEINEEEYHKSRKGRKTETLKKLKAKLEDYRNWLLSLTILDPACGSGAFLNQALDFLIKEHTYIDELETSLFGGGLVFKNIENTILENNIYGVDLNEESVEIAKLSLWLRTAQPRRKLNTLNNNIKCGNSLIDDPKVAGDKAFNWQEEFPKIFPKKNKKVWHITTATHNSRYSQRMFDNNVKTGKAIWLDEKGEIIITRTIADIVKESKIDIVEYNICGDHMHLLLVCEEEELTSIVGKLKAVSSRKYNIEKGITITLASSSSTRGHVPLSDTDTDTEEKKEKKKYNSLWTQKFGKSEIKNENYLNNAIEYIRNNRIKHELPKSEEIEKLKKEFLCTVEHAFRTEYNGGFDVVIGNPPYGIFLEDNEEVFYKANYPLTNYKINLYILFIERMFQVFDKGIIHFIIPKSLLFNTYFEKIRRHLLEKSKVHEIFMLSEKVFLDAEVGGSLILKFEPNKNKNNKKEKIRLISAETYFDFEGNNCIINDIEQLFFLNVPHCEISPIVKGGSDILEKLHKYKPIKEYYKLKNGLNPGNIKHILVSDKKETDNHKPIIWGKEFTNYYKNWGGQFVNYDQSLADNLTLDDIKSKEGMKKQTRIDFALRTPELFEIEKLLVRKTGDKFVVSKDNYNLYFDTLVHGIYQTNESFDLDFLLAVLNSKPATIFYRLLHDIKGKVFAKISLDKLGSFPLPKGSKEERKEFSRLAIKMTELTLSISVKRNSFIKYIKSQFNIEKPSKKLQSWHELEFADFIKELNKAIKPRGHAPLTKKAEMEWMELFEEKKAQAQTLKSEIEKTDKEIDKMVYELYGLTEGEIKIVEGAV